MFATQSSITNGTTTEKQGLSEADFQDRLTQLAIRWNKHCEEDLALRHETGKLFNLKYGSPATRQTRGHGILKEAAERLGIDMSDISRTRWFANRFQSIQDLKQQHPNVQSWTQVRDLLGRLSKDKPAGKSPVVGKAAVPLRKVRSALDTLTASLKALGDLPDDPKARNELVEKFQEVVRALPHGLGIRLVVDEV